ncbi:hypothetical protein RYB01_25115 [Pseudomonas syringae]|nr:hypothetical protein [Pseudomonas syringae]
MESKEQLCEQALIRILESLYPDGDQQLSSFIVTMPGRPITNFSVVANIFVRERQYVEALIFLRRNGAPHLRDISISSLWSIITTFVTENYYYISNGRLKLEAGISLARQTSPEGITSLSEALHKSSLFSPINKVTLYPLVTVRVENGFQSRHFAFTRSNGLAASLEGFGIRHSSLIPTQFPPFAYSQQPGEPTANWLCISSPDSLIARKLACATLGALALTPISRERYLQTGRSIHGGYCTLENEHASFTLRTAPMTPRISSDIVITHMDHAWLEILSTLFDREEHAQRSHVRALEYFHRAWFDESRERFPILCISLDSLVGAQAGHTKAAVNFVVSTLGEPVDRDRLLMLLKLRGAVVHGAAPDVYESQIYDAYYAKYLVDPIADLELVVAKCLRQEIFQGKLQTHPDPHAEIIKRAQESGQIPRNMHERSIIAGE